jgi:membrane associated rhomboid family serine protease
VAPTPSTLVTGTMSFATTQARSGFGFGFTLTPWVKRLLIANSVIFLVMLATSPAFFVQWFAFTPTEALTRPWGLLTYMFIHGSFWHVALNMLILFFFGPPLEQKWGSTDFLKFYLAGGLGGALLSFIFAPSAPIIGASAAVYGTMLGFAWIWPNAPIYIWGIFPVKAKWLVAFLFVVTFISSFGGVQDGVAHFAHLGGLLAAFLYLRFAPPGGTSNRFAASSGFDPSMAVVPQKRREKPEKARKKREPVHRRLLRTPAGGDDRPEEELLDEVDRILDKISSSGISSLTTEERRVLDEVSRRQQTD